MRMWVFIFLWDIGTNKADHPTVYKGVLLPYSGGFGDHLVRNTMTARQQVRPDHMHDTIGMCKTLIIECHA